MDTGKQVIDYHDLFLFGVYLDRDSGGRELASLAYRFAKLDYRGHLCTLS